MAGRSLADCLLTEPELLLRAGLSRQQTGAGALENHNGVCCRQARPPPEDSWGNLEAPFHWLDTKFVTVSDRDI